MSMLQKLSTLALVEIGNDLRKKNAYFYYLEASSNTILFLRTLEKSTWNDNILYNEGLLKDEGILFTAWIDKYSNIFSYVTSQKGAPALALYNTPNLYFSSVGTFEHFVIDPFDKDATQTPMYANESLKDLIVMVRRIPRPEKSK